MQCIYFKSKNFMPPLKKYHLNDEEACSGTHSMEIQNIFCLSDFT